jgi:hypothetical protein
VFGTLIRSYSLDADPAQLPSAPGSPYSIGASMAGHTRQTNSKNSTKLDADKNPATSRRHPSNPKAEHQQPPRNARANSAAWGADSDACSVANGQPAPQPGFDPPSNQPQQTWLKIPNPPLASRLSSRRDGLSPLAVALSATLFGGRGCNCKVEMHRPKSKPPTHPNRQRQPRQRCYFSFFPPCQIPSIGD